MMLDGEKTKKILNKLLTITRSGNVGTSRFVAEEAISYFERHKENLEKREASEERDHSLAEIEKHIGDVHRIIGDFDQALSHYRKMKELSKGIGEAQYILDAYISMGEIYKIRGEWDKAMKNLKKALQVAKTTHNQVGEAESSRLIGYVNWRIGNFNKAEEFFQKALKLSEVVSDQSIQGKAFIDIGNLSNERGDLDQAQVYYDRALVILKGLDDKYELARLYNNMGDIGIKKKDWAKGIRYFEKCNSVARSVRDPRWKGWSLFNAAECYSKSGNPKKAEEYCERAELALSHTEDKMGRAYVQINYGIAFRFLSDWELSEQRFQNGLKQLEELRSPSTLGWAYVEYARMLLDKGDLEMAKAHFRVAISMYRKVGATAFIDDLKKELAGLRAN